MARALLYGLMILGLLSGLLAFLFSPDNNRNNFFNSVFAYFGVEAQDPRVPATVLPPQSLEEIKTAIDEQYRFFKDQEKLRKELEAMHRTTKEVVRDFELGDRFTEMQAYQEALLDANRRLTNEMRENTREMNQRLAAVTSAYSDSAIQSSGVALSTQSMQSHVNEIRNLNRANLELLDQVYQQARDMRAGFEAWKTKSSVMGGASVGDAGTSMAAAATVEHMDRLKQLQVQLDERMQDFNHQLEDQRTNLRRQQDDFEFKLADLQYTNEALARSNQERLESQMRDQKERMELSRRQAEDRRAMARLTLEDVTNAINRHDALLSYQESVRVDIDDMTRAIKEAAQQFRSGTQFQQAQEYQEMLLETNRRTMRDMQENIRQMKQRAQEVASAFDNRTADVMPRMGLSLQDSIDDIQRLSRTNIDVIDRAEQQTRDVQLRLEEWKQRIASAPISSVGQDQVQPVDTTQQTERLKEIQARMSERVQDFYRQLKDQKLQMQAKQDDLELRIADLSGANEELMRANRDRAEGQAQYQKERMETIQRQSEGRQDMVRIAVMPPPSLAEVMTSIDRHEDLLAYQKNFSTNLDAMNLRIKEAAQSLQSEARFKEVQEYQAVLMDVNRQAVRDMQENLRLMKQRAEDLAMAYQHSREAQPLPVSRFVMRSNVEDIRDLSRDNMDIFDRAQQQARDVQARLEDWKRQNDITAFSPVGQVERQAVDTSEQTATLERLRAQLSESIRDFTRHLEAQKAQVRRQQDNFELQLADLQRANEELVRSNREKMQRQLQEQSERMQATRRQLNDQKAQMDEQLAAQRQRVEDLQALAQNSSGAPKSLNDIKSLIDGQKRFFEDRENFQQDVEGLTRRIHEAVRSFELGEHFKQVKVYQEHLLDVNRQAMQDMEENLWTMKQRIEDVASAYRNRAAISSLDPVAPMPLQGNIQDIRDLSRANAEILERTQQQLQDMQSRFGNWQQGGSGAEAAVVSDRNEVNSPQIEENAARLAQFQNELREKVQDFSRQLEDQKARMQRQQEDFEFKLADLQRANEDLMRSNREKMAGQLQGQKERMQENRRQSDDRRTQMDERLASQRQRVKDMQAMTRMAPVEPPKSLGEIKNAIERQNQFFEEQAKIKSQLEEMNGAITEKVRDFENAFQNNAAVANARFQTQYAELAQQRDALYQQLMESERSMQAAHRNMSAPIKAIGERISEKSRQNAESLQDLSDKYHQLDVMRIILVDDHQEKLDEYRRTLENLQEHRNLVMQGLTGTTNPSMRTSLARQDEVEDHLRRMVNDFGDNERKVDEHNDNLREQARYASQTEHFRDDLTFQRQREQMDAMDEARRRLAESMWQSRQTIRDQRQAMREKMEDMENNRKDRLIQIREFMAHFKQVQEYQETLMEVNREAMRDMRDNIQQMKQRAEEVASAYQDRSSQPMQMAVSNLSPQANTENIRQLSRANMEILQRTQQQIRDMQSRLDDWKQKAATLQMPDLGQMEAPNFIDMKEQTARLEQVQTQLAEKVRGFNRQLEDQNARMRQQQEEFEHKLGDLQRANEELARSTKEKMANQLQDQKERMDSNRRQMEDKQAQMDERMADQKQKSREQQALAKERLQDQQQRMRDQKALLEDRIRDQQMRMKEMMR